MGDLAVQLGFYPADWVGGDMSKGACLLLVVAFLVLCMFMCMVHVICLCFVCGMNILEHETSCMRFLPV